MSDPRPYPPTEWEADQKKDADSAVDKADAAVIKADAAVVDADASMQDLIESSKNIAANTEAVQKITKEALIAENRSTRRRNNLLTGMLAVVLLIVGYLGYRDVRVHTPQRENIQAIAEKLEECTTPGPRTPTADDPATGHKCFDDGQARTGEAIANIVDADGNGKIDTQEILAAIERFEIFLSNPGD